MAENKSTSRNAEHYLDPTPAAADRRMSKRDPVISCSKRTPGGITIVLAGVPPSMNQFAGRKNVWQYREYKQQWTSAVCYVSRQNRPPEPFDKATVSVCYRFSDRKRRDPDNYAPKVLMDGLTMAGIIKDDSFAHISLYVCAEDEPGSPRATIVVTERTLPVTTSTTRKLKTEGGN